MSLSVCIPDLIEQGKLTGKRAERAMALYPDLVRQYESKFGRAAAESMATKKTIAALEDDAAHRKFVAGLAAKAQSDWLGAMRAKVGGGDKPIDPFAARVALESLDKKIDAVRNGYLEGLGEDLLKHRRNVLGQVRHRDDLTLALKERFGEKTGDLNAKELADTMGAVMEAMRIRRNAAGGNTKKLDNFVFPQRHDSRAIRALAESKDEALAIWRAFGPIENARIRDVETGEWATGLRRETILLDAFESMWTDGANKSKPGASFAGSMANQRSDARIIHFANADDWLAYTQRFGGKDNIYDIFVGHVSAVSREIVLMEEMGPNPAAMLRFQNDWIAKSIGQHGTQKQVDKVPKFQAALQDTYDHLSGAAMLPTDRGVAKVASGVRAWQVTTKLGGAVLKTAPDFVLMLRTARFNRLGVMRTLSEYVKLWTPADFVRGSESARANARLNAKLRLITDDWLALSNASYRFTGQEFSGELSRRLADGVIRGTGLSRHTRNGQMALGRQFWANFTEWRERAFTELHPKVQQNFARHGISSGDWDKLRASPLTSESGHDWLFPGKVADQRVADRFTTMVLAETEMGVIVPHIRTRVLLNKAGKPGDFWGEVGRSAVLFKSFPLDIIIRHGGFTMERADIGSRAAYAIALTPSMIAAGALSVQLGNLAAMKDPEPMESDEFLLKSVAASGALGVAGDALFNQGKNYEMSLLQWAAGPLFGDTIIGTAADIRENVRRSADRNPDTESRWAMDAFDRAQREVPGNNIWYLRQAYQRLFVDNVRRMIDEEAAERRFERQEKYAEDQGTEYWAPPGEGIAGMRAPDLSNALAEAPE